MEMNARNLWQMPMVALVLGLHHVSLPAAEEGKPDRRPAPLFDGLGSHRHPISTKSKLAQRYFNQGFTLLYGFNHAEAIRSFEGAAQIDPGSAMAYWGMAYAYGPNINMPMSEKAVPKAWEALQKAIALRAQ